jgi:UPF0755 protein
MKFSALKRFKEFQWFRVGIPIAVGVVLLAVVVVRLWYTTNLRPLEADSSVYKKFVIELGDSVADIGRGLEEAGIVKSSTAFAWYVKGDQAGVSLLAGSYSISPSMSVPIIVNLLSEGRIDSSLVTLLPARRLEETRQELAEHWPESEVNAALAADYDHPLLRDKPAAANLEGYVFPDTYEIDDSTTPQELIRRSLDNFYKKIEERNLEPEIEAQGLNFHQAITLASIVEKEAGSEDDKPKIAQVFLKRLHEGIALGSDVTFFYAADELGIAASVDLDSPYNTRLYKGLPPGPIASITITSLEAVAEPANTDYLYFVAGDDGQTHFSMTLSEHNANVEKYCDELCKLP